MIHVIRNPKDVCVSFYHHYKFLHFYTGTFEEFEALFLNDKGEINEIKWNLSPVR